MYIAFLFLPLFHFYATFPSSLPHFPTFLHGNFSFLLPSFHSLTNKLCYMFLLLDSLLFQTSIPYSLFSRFKLNPLQFSHFLTPSFPPLPQLSTVTPPTFAILTPSIRPSSFVSHLLHSLISILLVFLVSLLSILIPSFHSSFLFPCPSPFLYLVLSSCSPQVFPSLSDHRVAHHASQGRNHY